MRKLRERETEEVLTVDTAGLAARYGVGESTARKIGKESGALIKLGRRTLYLVDRADDYIRAHAASD